MGGVFVIDYMGTINGIDVLMLVIGFFVGRFYQKIENRRRKR
jgi:hypothetical protein|tara:strand:+ start:271 stop:396 length:126 start_codon:yes stop_codon:yes gene_type:complete